MKKSLTLAVSFLILISSCDSLEAADYMIGAKAGYYAWQPFYKELEGSGMSDIEWGTGFLYGPIFSIMFTPEISVSLSGLIGKQSTHWQSLFSEFSGDPSTEITGTYYFEVFRADFDTALSYRVSDQFKIFAGYKYQYLEISYYYTEVRTDTADDSISEVDVGRMDRMKSPFHGPALGVGYSLPLGEHYFFAANVSCLYMWGKFEMKNKMYTESTVPPFPLELRDNDSYDVTMKQMGVNFEPTIGFSPGEGMPIITLGLRYQRFWVEFVDSKQPGGDPFPDKKLKDTLIGGFVSAVIVF